MTDRFTDQTQQNREADFNWEGAGLLTTTTDMQVISASTLAFKEAWQELYSQNQDVDLSPPFQLVQKFSFLGKGLKHDKADLYDIRLVIEPIDRSVVSIDELKKFTVQVSDKIKEKTLKLAK